MPIDKKPGESKDDFISRCIGIEINAGKEPDQAAAICYAKWEEFGKTASVTDNTWSTESPISINLESYDDYPEAAKRNAQVALDWAKENGWGDCGTPVGKVRANQLANGEAITRDTIARMAAFERHRQNSQRKLGDGCGRLMWQAWGGDEGIEWAQRKLQEIDRQELKFKRTRRVIFNEDFNEEVVREYKAMGYQVHIRSSRKIKKKDRKVWNKLKSVGLTEDALVFGEVKDLDKRYSYDLLMTGQDPILEKLLIMGQPASKYRVIKSKPIHSTEEMVLASQEMLKDVDLRLAVVVKFQYEEIPGIPPAASGSRPFCSKILNSNRLYSLDELKSLPTSHLTDLGLPADVITFRGGFYKNPDSGQTTPWCRHQWTAKVVVE